jgi:hypothetical protein
MVNWKKIHENFVKEWDSRTYQQKWEEEGLTYQDAQEWISAGFEPGDYLSIKKWKNYAFTPQQAKYWKEIGLSGSWDAEFAAYLRWKDYQVNSSLNLNQLREEFNIWLKKDKPVQEYLDAIYPQNQRKEIIGLQINQMNFHGTLDLFDFANLNKLSCDYNNLTSLNLNNCSKLKKIDCSGNQLINLDLSSCPNLVDLTCSNNNLINLTLPKNASSLKKLDLSGNDFNQNLSFLKEAVGLEDLYLYNNRFTGSLEPLKEMERLEHLVITDTDLDSGLEYLPNNIKNFYYSTSEKRPESKVKAIEQELKKFGKPEDDNFNNFLLTWKKANPEKVKIAQHTCQIEQLQVKVSQLETQLAALQVQQQAQILQTNPPKGGNH